MESAVLIAKVIGPCYMIIALGILRNKEWYQNFFRDFAQNAAFIFLSGFLALIVGLLIVLSHNEWIAHWRVLITFFGWAGILKGIWLVGFPRSVGRFLRVYQLHPQVVVVHAIAALVMGTVITFFGYTAG